jgi:hypothetical protein
MTPSDRIFEIKETLEEVRYKLDDYPVDLFHLYQPSIPSSRIALGLVLASIGTLEKMLVELDIIDNEYRELSDYKD